MDIKQGLRKVGNEYAVALGTQLLKQGRKKSTGGLIDSISKGVKLVKFQDGWKIEVWGNNYWRYVDKGVMPHNVKGGKGYIKAIMGWLKKKGIGGSNKVIRGIAFAILNTHKKVGIPSRGGRRDKSRMHFVDKALKTSATKINHTIDQVLGNEVDRIVKKF